MYVLKTTYIAASLNYEVITSYIFQILKIYTGLKKKINHYSKGHLWQILCKAGNTLKENRCH
jgi:hypothetical protein